MSVAVISWHCAPCHTTARRPARFSISGKCSEIREHSHLQIVSPSMKYCFQDTAWHSFSQIFWQFEQISRKWFWFLAPVGHLWRRISSAACATSLKYPCLPETYAMCFPGCGTVIQSTKSPFSLHTLSPAQHQAGVKGSITLNDSAVTCLWAEDACAHNTLFCARFWEGLWLQSLHSGTKEE